MIPLNNNCFYKDYCVLFGTNECSSSCIKYLEMKNLLVKSNIPERLQKPIQLVIPEEDRSAFAFLTTWAQNMKTHVNMGKNMVLYSANTGNGKTSWAIKLMINYFSQIWNGNGFRTRGIFVHVPTYIADKKNSISDGSSNIARLERDMRLADLIILDDLGTNKMTEYDISLLTSLIDSRIINGKSMIVTTNCNKQELTNILGARIADRIYNTSVTVTFKSKSKR